MCLILRHFENLNKGLKQSYSNQQLSGVQLKESKEAMVTEAMRFKQWGYLCSTISSFSMQRRQLQMKTSFIVVQVAVNTNVPT